MEKINFKIDLDIITHNDVKEHPFVNIGINGFPQFGEILDKPTVIDIDVEIEENTENFLTIEYNNKDPENDVEFDEKHITKDKRVVINGIKINDIDLDFFAFDEEETFKYESTDGTVQEFGFYATKLSWNGRTTLKFTTPVYLWILENI